MNLFNIFVKYGVVSDTETIREKPLCDLHVIKYDVIIFVFFIL